MAQTAEAAEHFRQLGWKLTLESEDSSHKIEGDLSGFYTLYKETAEGKMLELLTSGSLEFIMGYQCRLCEEMESSAG